MLAEGFKSPLDWTLKRLTILWISLKDVGGGVQSLLRWLCRSTDVIKICGRGPLTVSNHSQLCGWSTLKDEDDRDEIAAREHAHIPSRSLASFS